MFVVEISSTGAEILFLMVPGAKECLVVKLLCGIGGDTSEACALRFVVNALERLVAIVMETYAEGIQILRQKRMYGYFLPSTNEVDGSGNMAWGEIYPNG